MVSELGGLGRRPSDIKREEAAKKKPVEVDIQELAGRVIGKIEEAKEAGDTRLEVRMGQLYEDKGTALAAKANTLPIVNEVSKLLQEKGYQVRAKTSYTSYDEGLAGSSGASVQLLLVIEQLNG